MKNYNLILLGPAGSGKSTQADRLVKRFGLEHVDTGSLLRQAVETGSSFGQEIGHIINGRNALVPDVVIARILEEKIAQVPADRGIILDGAPRRLSQVPVVENVFRHTGRTLDATIFIHLSIVTAVERIRTRYHCTVCSSPLVLGRDIASVEDTCPVCGAPIAQREDDTPDGIRRRYEIFMNDTLPVIDHYRSSGRLIEVDGGNDPADIEREIAGYLEKGVFIPDVASGKA